jgi:hypothetical protein
MPGRLTHPNTHPVASHFQQLNIVIVTNPSLALVPDTGTGT